MILPEKLNQNGLDYFRRVFSVDETPLNFEEIEKIREFVRENIKPRVTLNAKHTSYGLKHIVERLTHNYVSNGNFIAAMILEGYKYKQYPRSLNCIFNGDYKKIVEMEKEIERQKFNVKRFRG